MKATQEVKELEQVIVAGKISGIAWVKTHLLVSGGIRATILGVIRPGREEPSLSFRFLPQLLQVPPKNLCFAMVLLH